MIRLLTKTVDVIVRDIMNDISSELHNKRVELVDQYTNDDVRDDVEIHYEEVFVYDVSEEDAVDDSQTLEVRVTSDAIVLVLTDDNELTEQKILKTM